MVAAQYRLTVLRQAHSPQRRQRSAPKAELTTPLADVVQQLPAHLGWGSLAATAVLRTQSARQKSQAAATPPPPAIQQVHPKAQSRSEHRVDSRLRGNDTVQAATIRLYPSLALGMLREKQAAAGRVWLLLRHLDSAGRGWHTLENVRALLTMEEAPHRLCGWRQLRKLLGRGDGIFWERANGRLWLRGTAKVAAALGVEKLNGRSVALPLTTLLQPVGQVRAHFYASFHSGRCGHGGRCGHSSRSRNSQTAAPISRETLAELTHTNRQTQRHYEAQTGIRPQRHFALGQTASPAAREEVLWRKGKAAFVFTDHQGQHGAAQQKYVAWQLPNSYQGPHQRLNKGRQKQLNRQLADLRNLGIAGNGNCQGNERLSFKLRRYVANGRLAKQVTTKECYWRGPAKRNVRFWYQGQEGY